MRKQRGKASGTAALCRLWPSFCCHSGPVQFRLVDWEEPLDASATALALALSPSAHSTMTPGLAQLCRSARGQGGAAEDELLRVHESNGAPTLAQSSRPCPLLGDFQAALRPSVWADNGSRSGCKEVGALSALEQRSSWRRLRQNDNASGRCSPSSRAKGTRKLERDGVYCQGPCAVHCKDCVRQGPRQAAQPASSVHSRSPMILSGLH